MNDARDPSKNGYFRNWVGIAGAGPMLASFFGGVLFAALELLSGEGIPYGGFIYLLCMALMVVGFLLILMVFFAALRLPAAGPASSSDSGSRPHAHLLLASGGLSMVGVAGLAVVLCSRQEARQAAVSTVGRFAFLFLAVVGVEILT